MKSFSYTVTERSGCRLVSGEVPLSAFTSLIDGMPKGAVMDPDAARMLGVKFAFGMPEDLEALKKDPLVLANARADAEVEGVGLSAEAREWLATGERGTSSETIFGRLTGVKFKTESHPHDPEDLRRCRLLLEQIPEFRPRFAEVAKVSPEWAAIVAHWDELCSLMDTEAPKWRTKRGSAGETYRRMLALIKSATPCDEGDTA